MSDERLTDEELLRRVKQLIAAHEPSGAVDGALEMSHCTAYSESQFCCIDFVAGLTDAEWADIPRWREALRGH